MIKKIPQETDYYHYYNANPSNLRTTDCVVRALATALNQSWETTYRELFELGCANRRPAEDDWVVQMYLKKHNAVRISQPRKRDRKKFTGAEICFLIQQGKFIDNDGCVLPYDRYFLNIGRGHCSCIIDGKINDIWNCSFESVGKMWAIPKEC